MYHVAVAACHIIIVHYIFPHYISFSSLEVKHLSSEKKPGLSGLDESSTVRSSVVTFRPQRSQSVDRAAR